MVILRVLSAIIVGMVFVLSGFLKLLDPIGTSLIIGEYLRLFGLDVFLNYSVFLGMALSVIEFTLGVGLSLRFRIKKMAYVLLAFISFFTCLTFYIALFSPITDCGCFGEAIKLTNYETFGKNLVLLTLSIFIFIQRKNYRFLSSSAFERAALVIAILFGLSFSMYSYIYLPPVDFTLFRPGAYLEDVVSSAEEEIEYSTIFIYEKDGEQKEFIMGNLPDKTWTFVDSKTIVVNEDAIPNTLPLPISTESGEYLTDYIINGDYNYFISVIYDDDISDEDIEKIRYISEWVIEYPDYKHIILCSTDKQFVDSLKQKVISPIYYSDYKALITLNRSNGGLVYIDSGEIIKKWPVRSLPIGELGLLKFSENDPQIVAVKEEIFDSLFWEITLFLALFGLLFGNIALKKYNAKHEIVVSTYRELEEQEKQEEEEKQEDEER